MKEPPRREGLPLFAAAENLGPPALVMILREAIAANAFPSRQPGVYLPTVPLAPGPERTQAINCLITASRLALLHDLRRRLIGGEELIAFGLRVEQGKQRDLQRSTIPPA
jgi:hypothetical protein